jgi:hypothetical protein
MTASLPDRQAALNARAVYLVDPATGLALPGAQSLGASEVHIGEVHGGALPITVTPTISTTAYAANDVVGGKLTLANAVRVAGGTSILQSVRVMDRANQKAALQIVFFDADPTNATLTNDTQVDLSAGSHGDFPKIAELVVVAAADYVTIDNSGTDYAIAALPALARPIKAATGTTLYAVVITTGTPTYGNAAALSFRFGFLPVN